MQNLGVPSERDTYPVAISDGCASLHRPPSFDIHTPEEPATAKGFPTGFGHDTSGVHSQRSDSTPHEASNGSGRGSKRRRTSELDSDDLEERLPTRSCLAHSCLDGDIEPPDLGARDAEEICYFPSDHAIDLSSALGENSSKGATSANLTSSPFIMDPSGLSEYIRREYAESLSTRSATPSDIWSSCIGSSSASPSEFRYSDYALSPELRSECDASSEVFSECGSLGQYEAPHTLGQPSLPLTVQDWRKYQLYVTFRMP